MDASGKTRQGRKCGGTATDYGAQAPLNHRGSGEPPQTPRGVPLRKTGDDVRLGWGNAGRTVTELGLIASLK